MVEKRIGPERFREPSTFRTFSGERRVRRVRLLFRAKDWFIIMPSAPLSRRARALIVFWDFCPTRETLSVTEGDLIFRIVPLGTGSESIVSNKESSWRDTDPENNKVLHDSAAVGLFRNPDYRHLGQDEKCQSGVLGYYRGEIRWAGSQGREFLVVCRRRPVWHGCEDCYCGEVLHD